MPWSRAAGDAAEGARLVERFECRRCHLDLEGPQIAFEKSCSGCHQDILSGKVSADAAALNEWQQHVRHFVRLPPLRDAKTKLRNGWLQRFLLEPHVVRPALEESMPRLALTAAQARDLAAYLAPHDAAPSNAALVGDAAHGRQLLDERGCGTCHRINGAALKATPLAAPLDAHRMQWAMRLAPDLAQARERLLPGYVEKWLRRPSAQNQDALMPDIPLSEPEIVDIAAYFESETPRRAEPRAFVRLPLLTRRVTFSELKQRVLRKTCWHCHSDPDYAIGDGGPGNSGGFGFSGRRINLAELEGVLSGYRDDQGETRSLLSAESPSNESRLVQALLARHAEERGAPTGPVRGMPMGLPALPSEEIQLVESWVAQQR
ncbi:MAG: c-type cytochrome [Polyangiaceae bacterium]